MHINRHAGQVIRKVPAEWLTLNAQVTRQVNSWSRRDDLTAYIGPDAGRGIAAALFDPTSNEVEINTSQAFGETVGPAAIDDFTERDTHFEWPKAAGAILHESMHAQYTTMAMCKAFEVLTPDEDHWFDMLDEPRIEGLGVKQYPENREFLRACALGIVFKDMKNTELITLVSAAAQSAVLGLGRVDAGVLKKKDVKRLRTKVHEILPDEVYEALRDIWREFLTLRGDVDLDRMYELAREFNRIVQKLTKERGEDKPQDIKDWLDGLFGAMNGDRIGTEFDAKAAASGQQSKERAEVKNRQAQQRAQDQQQNEKVSKATFQPDSSTNRVRSSSNSVLTSSRQPTPEERTVAAKLSDALKRAKYRDRISTVRDSANPPGRLNTTTAMQKTATRKQGGATSHFNPWREKQFHHVEDPNLTAAIICDISGSMKRAMQPIAVSVWVISEAIQRVKGRAAAVYFGNDIFSVLKPGEHLKTVNVWSAADGTEHFDRAFRAVDGGLHLLEGRGARILFVCSDGAYGGPGELEAVEKWLLECKRNGVAVVWIHYVASARVDEIARVTGCTPVLIDDTVTAAADAIGKACIEALKNASR